MSLSQELLGSYDSTSSWQCSIVYQLIYQVTIKPYEHGVGGDNFLALCLKFVLSHLVHFDMYNKDYEILSSKMVMPAPSRDSHVAMY